MEIEDINISFRLEGEKVHLILKNLRQSQVKILICYQKNKTSGTVLHGNNLLSIGEIYTIELPKEFEKYHRFCFSVGKKEHSIINVFQQQLSNESKKQPIIEPQRPEIDPPSFETKQKKEAEDLTDQVQQPLIEENLRHKQPSIDYQQKAKITVQKTCEQIREMVRAYREGEAIDFENIIKLTPSQNVLLILNLIGNTIKEWKGELEQHRESNHDLIDTLKYSEQCIKDKLKVIRGDSTPAPNPLELETDINTEAELDEIQNKCSRYVVWFGGRLFGYEERTEINNLEEYNQFIPQFIKDRLFNSAARFIAFNKLPRQLCELLDLIGYEVVPIEIGKTQTDPRIHDIQGSRQTANEPGTVVDVILPGLRLIADSEIIQKPVVIRGE